VKADCVVFTSPKRGTKTGGRKKIFTVKLTISKL